MYEEVKATTTSIDSPMISSPSLTKPSIVTRHNSCKENKWSESKVAYHIETHLHKVKKHIGILTTPKVLNDSGVLPRAFIKVNSKKKERKLQLGTWRKQYHSFPSFLALCECRGFIRLLCCLAKHIFDGKYPGSWRKYQIF